MKKSFTFVLLLVLVQMAAAFSAKQWPLNDSASALDLSMSHTASKADHNHKANIEEAKQLSTHTYSFDDQNQSNACNCTLCNNS